MTKSFSITVPNLTAELLDRWCSDEGRSRSNLVAYVLERIVSWKYSGTVKDIPGGDVVLTPPSSDDSQALIDIIAKRSRKERLTPKERAILSRNGLTPQQVNAFDQLNGDLSHAKPH